MNNPYSWNTVNPDLFYGRESLLSEMLSGLPGSPRFSFGLAGARRMGKTTLLRKIQKELASSILQWSEGGLMVIPIYIDTLALPESFNAAHIWAFIIKEIAKLLSVENTADSLEFDSFKSTLQPALINSDLRPRVIVLFDEVERIVAREWARSFFDHWRSLLSNSPNLSEYFTAVFSGAREMEILRRDELGSPLKDILEWKNLRVLDYEDSCQLMQEPIERQWPENILQLIYQESGGHPMLIQYIMQYLCSSGQNDIEQTITKGINRFNKERAWQFSEWWHKYCSPMAQQIYAYLPDDGTPIQLAQVAREFGAYEVSRGVEILQHVGLITEDDDGYLIRYTGKMFRRWYSDLGGLSTRSLYKASVHTELIRILGQEIADNYVLAWNLFEENKMENHYFAMNRMKVLFDGLVDAKLGSIPNTAVPENARPREKIMVMANSIELDQPMQLASNYELLCELTLKYRPNNNIVQNASFSAGPVVNDELDQLMKQWENIIVQLIGTSSQQ